MLIFVATKKEAAALERADFGYERIASEPFEVWKNSTRTVIVSGIGLVNASLAFAWAAQNIEFETALNIGAAGATDALENAAERCGEFYEISDVVCLEPYNERKYELAKSGVRLATASRPVSTASERKHAAKFAELVDMEGYAFARAAAIWGKKIKMIKMLSDFSETCDISASIENLRNRLAECEGIWI